MKNINSAGPSEERQAQVDALMAKLRQRGSIGDSSLTQEAASFMRAPPPPPPPAPQEMIIEQPVVEFGAGLEAGEAGASGVVAEGADVALLVEHAIE